MVLKHLANMDSQEYSKKTNLSPKTLKEICEADVCVLRTRFWSSLQQVLLMAENLSSPDCSHLGNT